MVFKLNESFLLITSGGERSFGGMADYHYHEQLELYYLVSGECRYFIGNKIYPVSAGQLVLIPASMIHKTIYNTQRRDRIVLSVKKDFMSYEKFERIIDINKPAIFDFADEANEEVKRIFEKILFELERKDFLSENLCKNLYFELFSLIAREGRDISCEVQKLNNLGNDAIIIEKITQYITENYRENITLEGAAEMARLSKGYLSKLFKRVTGLGFKEYLLTVRVLNAKALLKETDKSVSAIAYECGFNDSNYFSKIFRQFSQYSPLGYRKSHKK